MRLRELYKIDKSVNSDKSYKHGDYARGGKPMPKAKKGRTKHPLHGKLVG